ncbi:putative mitochondrial uncoupling protein 4 isoform X2 [Apostichopus japonicus]|uniref:Putative mitochondrial uncoupling protein 4 isoform X2 n=1 Tax=Stichopus japonicus TaxID=307972 RepID=A0A2G8K5K4_STIJA|nr:putative mitochondrial uncoupling protein 4 isoform X2 [Apostichopus japonicus]
MEAVKLKTSGSRTKSPSTIFITKYCLSAFAATAAETVTYPLDLTKTRLQIQGEVEAYKHGSTRTQLPTRGMIGTAIGVVEEEGLSKLWQGVTPAIYRHVVYTGCRMGSYEYIREDLLGRNSDGTFPVWKAATAGMMAGALGQFFASPTDLVKVLMQTEGRRRLEGKPPRVKTAIGAFSYIVRKRGFRGLWRGWVPNVQRAALVNMGDLTTYDTAKQAILRNTTLSDNWVTHALASSCSGLVAASLSTPADVVKTRVMNQPIGKDGRGLLYKSSIDCLLKSVRQEGFFSLYKGFLPIWARMAPWSLTFWITYEEIRRFSGIDTF